MENSNVSERQLAANRANAQKSTGPTSEEGKNRSRRNACRHHLTGQVTTMTDVDRAAYEKFLASFMEDQKPEGAVEIMLVQSFAHGYWRLKRAEAIEENNFAVFAENHAGRVLVDYPQIEDALLQAMAFFEDPHTFALLTLYEQRIHRKSHKDLSTFMDLKAARERNQHKKQSEKVMTAAAGMLAEIVNIRAGRAESKACEENGFVFSSSPEHGADPEPRAETGPEPPDPPVGFPEAA